MKAPWKKEKKQVTDFETCPISWKPCKHQECSWWYYETDLMEAQCSIPAALGLAAGSISELIKIIYDGTPITTKVVE